jgi:phosphatidate cytidylyltransferase
MSFADAANSTVFRSYLALVVILLLVAGAILAWLKYQRKQSVGSLWATYFGWLVMIPLVFFMIAWGRTPFILFIIALGIIGFIEFARATRLIEDRILTGLVILAILAMGVVIWMEDPRLRKPGWYGMFAIMPVWFTALLMIVPVVRNQPSGQLKSIALALVGFTYFGWMFGHLAYFANSENAYGYLLFIFFAVSAADIAAFTFGKLYGHRQLVSNISPNKTWAGALGALAFSMVLPWALWFSFPDFNPLVLVLTGIIVGIGGQLGDLAISFIKRDLEIKDMGHVIPGHGGILDRIDSLIYASPLFFHMVRWFYGI